MKKQLIFFILNLAFFLYFLFYIPPKNYFNIFLFQLIIVSLIFQITSQVLPKYLAFSLAFSLFFLLTLAFLKLINVFYFILIVCLLLGLFFMLK